MSEASDPNESEPVAEEPVASMWRPGWGSLVLLVAALPLWRAFSSTHIFYYRDTAYYWWPLHLWLRRTLLSGELPLWDPYVGYGMPAIADPARHIMLLPTLPLRFLPEVVGFNMSVLVPFLVSAAGLFLFLRRRVPPRAAAIGAITFALAGPILSCGSILNEVWTVGLCGWVLWAVDRLAERPSAARLVPLAALYAVQVAAGEPNSMLASTVISVAYAVVLAPGSAASLRDRARVLGLVLLAGLFGALLAAPQMLPTLDAARVSYRSAMPQGSLDWHLHPLLLLETLVSGYFGNPITGDADASLWLSPLTDGRGPYLASIYLGIPTLALALLSVCSKARSSVVFWWVVAAVSVVAAFGHFTPIYPALLEVVPALKTIRYPTKYFVFASLALSVLAAYGWSTLSAREGGEPDASPRRLGARFALAIPVLVAFGYLVVASGLASPAVAWMAGWVGSSNVAAASNHIAQTLPAALRLGALALAVTAACYLIGRSNPHSELLRSGVVALIVLDLFLANQGLNPTLPADLFRRSEWVDTVKQRNDRAYVYVESAFLISPDDPMQSGFRSMVRPTSVPSSVFKAVYHATVESIPSRWEVRQSAMEDLTALRSAEYWTMLYRLRSSTPEERARFLSRTGTRFYVTPGPLAPGLSRVLTIEPFQPMALYTAEPARPRFSVASTHAVVPTIVMQINTLFSAQTIPDGIVMLSEEPPPPAGAPGAAGPPRVEVLRDAPNDLHLVVTAPEAGGVLVMFDSYDPNWEVSVDGVDTPLLRADGLFRAVRIAPGRHDVVLEYRPAPFYLGLWISAGATLLLIALLLFERFRTPRVPQPVRARTEPPDYDSPEAARSKPS